MIDSERDTSENMNKVLVVTKLDFAIGKIEGVLERCEGLDLTDDEREVLELCISDLEKFRDRKEEEWDIKSHTEDEQGEK